MNQIVLENEEGDTNDSNFKIKRFLKNDGVKGIDFYANSAYNDNNMIWWGSGRGLTMLDKRKYYSSQEPPKISLSQVKINEQFIDYRNISDAQTKEIKFNETKQFENYPLNLELSHHKNHITFFFYAIDWQAPHKIKYSYMMEGLDPNWSQPNSEPKADYRNLPFGNYIFRVCSIGESGEWSAPF